MQKPETCSRRALTGAFIFECTFPREEHHTEEKVVAYYLNDDDDDDEDGKRYLTRQLAVSSGCKYDPCSRQQYRTVTATKGADANGCEDDKDFCCDGDDNNLMATMRGIIRLLLRLLQHCKGASMMEIKGLRLLHVHKNKHREQFKHLTQTKPFHHKQIVSTHRVATNM